MASPQSSPTKLPGVRPNGPVEAVRGIFDLAPSCRVSPESSAYVLCDIETSPIAPRTEPNTPLSTALAPLGCNNSAGFKESQLVLSVCSAELAAATKPISTLPESLPWAVLAPALMARAIQFTYHEDDDLPAAFAHPIVGSITNEMLAAADEAKEAIYKELGRDKRGIGQPSDGLTRNWLMGVMILNARHGGSPDYGQAERFGRCANKQLGKVRGREAAIDKAAKRQERKLLRTAPTDETGLVQLELSRLLKLVELRCEPYTPRSAAPKPAPSASRPKRAAALVDPPSDQALTECKVQCSAALPLNTPMTDPMPAAPRSPTLAQYMEMEDREEMDETMELLAENSRLRHQLAQEQTDHERAIMALEAGGDELRRAVRLLQSGLADAFEGWGAMQHCASRHGWNGELQLIDFEACGSDGLPDWNSSHLDSLGELCEASVEELCAQRYRDTQ